MASADLCEALERWGSDFCTGVPCSIFRPLYGELAKRTRWQYIPAVREDSAVAIAVGAYMAGRKPVVIMQNSGLGYSLNAFTSLALLYEIPLLVLASWRGYRGQDEPEHIIMGAAMPDILAAVGLSYVVLGDEDAHRQVSQAIEMVVQGERPVFVVVRQGVLV